MAQAFIGEIRAFPYAFAPEDWLICDGALLQQDHYPALFSVIGTYYGHRSLTDFRLPNLVGTVGIGFGRGSAGLTPRDLGATVGDAKAGLSINQMPAHQHQVNARFSVAASDLVPSPLPGLPFSRTFNQLNYSNAQFTPWNEGNGLAAATIGTAGGGQAHENRQPYVAITFCICILGEFPYH